MEERNFIYVYNNGGKFKFQKVKEGTASLCQGEHVFVSFTSQTLNCSGCLLLKETILKCKTCSVALCSTCSQANGCHQQEQKELTGNKKTMTTNKDTVEEEKRDDSLTIFKTMKTHHERSHDHLHHNYSLHPSQGGDHGLFPSMQTIQFKLLSTGSSRDLAERLTLFVNSRLMKRENQVENVFLKQDIDMAWVVLKNTSLIQEFKLKCGNELKIDLLDGWSVKWRIYSPPSCRTVYTLSGCSEQMLNDALFCSLLRRLLEEQLKMSPTEVDLVVVSEGQAFVVFTYGEYDVSFTRSIFLPDGVELQLTPTSATV